MVTNETRPSNFIVFGLIFEDKQIFKETVKCILGDEINEETYVVSEKENRMNSIYNKIRFDVYAEGDKIYSLDMQTGYTSEMIQNRLVYYACRAIGGQKVKNFEYGRLKMCVVTFIFEKNSYKSNQFLTKHYIATEIDGKIVKYSDLLNIVELNLGYYTGTENENLNILCEFLRIQNNNDLKNFYKNHNGSEFGGELYDKYLKVVINKDNIERVANMQLYQEKHQYRYLSENDVIFLKRIFRDELTDEVTNEVKNKITNEVTNKITNEVTNKINEEKAIKTAINLLKKNKLTIKEIAEVSELTIEKVKELKKQYTQKS